MVELLVPSRLSTLSTDKAFQNIHQILLNSVVYYSVKLYNLHTAVRNKTSSAKMFGIRSEYLVESRDATTIHA